MPFSRVGPPWGVAERPVLVPECPDLPQRSGLCRGVRGESLVFWAFFAVDSASRFLCGRFGQPSARVSPRILARPIGRACLRLMVDGEMVEVSPDVADVLVRVARAMQQGLAVTVAPQSTRLTAQEAAESLGVSRSTLVRMLDAGEIPFEKIRRHRRLHLADVLQFRKRQRRTASEALSDMVADAQAMGAYDDEPTRVREILAGVRSEG